MANLIEMLAGAAAVLVIISAALALRGRRPAARRCAWFAAGCAAIAGALEVYLRLR